MGLLLLSLDFATDILIIAAHLFRAILVIANSAHELLRLSMGDDARRALIRHADTLVFRPVNIWLPLPPLLVHSVISQSARYFYSTAICYCVDISAD